MKLTQNWSLSRRVMIFRVPFQVITSLPVASSLQKKKVKVPAYDFLSLTFIIGTESSALESDTGSESDGISENLSPEEETSIKRAKVVIPESPSPTPTPTPVIMENKVIR